MPKGISKKATIEYWTSQGFSEIESLSKIEEYKRLKYSAENFKKNHLTPEFWIKKGLNEVDAIAAAENQKNKISLKRIETKDKWITTINPPLGDRNAQSILYWIKRGFSEEESKNIVKDNGRKRSPRCSEYWVQKGFSEEEASEKVSVYQRRDKAFFVQKYGEERGCSIYADFRESKKQSSKRCTEYWMNRGLSYDAAIASVKDYQSQISIQNPTSITKYIRLGFSEKESKEIVCEILSHRWETLKEFWFKKGLNQEETSKKISEVQRTRSRKRKNYQVSKLEKSLIPSLIEITDDIKPQFRIDVNGNVFIIDYVLNGTIALEVFGDFWHANPLMYNPSDYMYAGKTAEDIQVQDKRRLEMISDLFEKVVVIWESEINANINRLQSFIQEKIDETC